MPQLLSRRRLIAATAMGGLAAAARPARAQTSLKGSGSVIVYDGGGSMGIAQRKAFSEPFEAETGIRVIHEAGVNSGVQRAAILAGAPKHDIANISGGSIAAFEKEGLLLPIDYGYWSKNDRDAYDVVPAAPFYAPAMIYSMLIAFDRGRYAGRPPSAWADLWNVEAFPGKRTLASGVNAADGCTFEIALLADGVAPDKLYPIDWERAFHSLDKLRGQVVKWWANGAESVQLQVDRQASLGSAWNGRIDGANDNGGNIGKVWNQGLLQWAAWAIPKGAANVENAQKYMAFMSRPEPQAKFSELITYGPTNALAFKHITPERAALLPTAPAVKGQQIVQNYEFWNATDATGQTGLRRAIAEWERWVSSH